MPFASDSVGVDGIVVNLVIRDGVGHFGFLGWRGGMPLLVGLEHG